MEVPQLYSVLYFFMLLMLGIGSMLGNTAAILTPLTDSKVIGSRFPKEVISGRHLPGCSTGHTLSTCVCVCVPRSCGVPLPLKVPLRPRLEQGIANMLLEGFVCPCEILPSLCSTFPWELPKHQGSCGCAFTAFPTHPSSVRLVSTHW